jgi:hypothetical protein
MPQPDTPADNAPPTDRTLVIDEHDIPEEHIGALTDFIENLRRVGIDVAVLPAPPDSDKQDKNETALPAPNNRTNTIDTEEG